MNTVKKRFIVEIDVPTEGVDMTWEEDKTGLQAFHDCIASCIPEISLDRLYGALKDESKYKEEYLEYTEKHNKVRDSFRVIEPLNK